MTTPTEKPDFANMERAAMLKWLNDHDVPAKRSKQDCIDAAEAKWAELMKFNGADPEKFDHDGDGKPGGSTATPKPEDAALPPENGTGADADKTGGVTTEQTDADRAAEAAVEMAAIVTEVEYLGDDEWGVDELPLWLAEALEEGAIFSVTTDGSDFYIRNPGDEPAERGSIGDFVILDPDGALGIGYARGDARTSDALHGSSTLPAVIDINGQPLALGDVVGESFKEFAGAVEDATAWATKIDEWNALSEEDRDVRLNATIDQLRAAAAEEAKIAEDDLDQVAANLDDEAEAQAAETEEDEDEEPVIIPDFPIGYHDPLITDEEWSGMEHQWASAEPHHREALTALFEAGIAYMVIVRQKAPDAPPALTGKIRMKAPEGATSCSWGTASYAVKNGHVHVPFEAVDALKSHGYTVNHINTK